MAKWLIGATLPALFMVEAFAMPYEVKGGITYAAPDGRRLKMTLYLPCDDGESLRPAVVLIHGGAWAIGCRHMEISYGRRFAQRGYVAAAIDYRKMPRYSFPNCLHDVKAAVRWLRLNADTFRIDPRRIGAFGDSAGGHLAAMLGATKPEDGFEGTENPGPSSAVQAVVSLYGPMDLNYFRSPPKRRFFRWFGCGFMEKFVGVPAKSGQDPYAAASPMTYADANTCPTLLIHGKKDGLVPWGQSQAFYEQLQALGVTTRLITFPEHGHAFDRLYPSLRERVFAEAYAFLKHNIAARAAIEEADTPD